LARSSIQPEICPRPTADPVDNSGIDSKVITVISMYPNPASDWFMIQYQLEDNGPLQMQIIDTKGAVVKQFETEKVQGLWIEKYPVDDITGGLETGDALTDEKKIKKLTLDPSIEAEYATENDLKVVIDMGDTDNDGDYDKLYSYGARSFSIWDANGDLVFDSGDEIGKQIALNEPTLFNQDEGEMDGRSGNKGGEPEALALGAIDGKTYAFVGLERQNAILVYDITMPSEARFVDYYKTGVEGDVSAEGMKFLPASDSPNGKNLLLVSYEVSGSTVVYEVNL